MRDWREEPSGVHHLVTSSGDIVATVVELDPIDAVVWRPSPHEECNAIVLVGRRVDSVSEGKAWCEEAADASGVWT